MKRKLVLTTVSFACLLTGLTLVSCGKEQGTAATANYKTMEVSRADRMLSRSFTAVVNGRQSVEIRPQVMPMNWLLILPKAAGTSSARARAESSSRTSKICATRRRSSSPPKNSPTRRSSGACISTPFRRPPWKSTRASRTSF